MRNNIKGSIHDAFATGFIVNMVVLSVTGSLPLSLSFKAQYLLLLSPLKSRAINRAGNPWPMAFCGQFFG
jgi:hypothetical protein